MLHISGTSHNETKISGEFWDFDHLYFAIAYLTGDFGIHPGYHPYPELKEVCQTLLGLNHELRETERGNREISVQSNGLSLTMFAPVGHEDKVIPEGWTPEHHFGNNDFDLDAFAGIKMLPADRRRSNQNRNPAGRQQDYLRMQGPEADHIWGRENSGGQTAPAGA